MQRTIFLFIVISFSVMPCFGQKSQPKYNFQDNKYLKNASVGICIQDMKGDKVLIFNETTALSPASTLKIITTATALEALGENFTYVTTLSTEKESLNKIIIKGYGDPTLGSEYLYTTSDSFVKEWIAQIKKQNIESPLSLLISDDYFGYQGISSKWIREDIGNYFAAGSYGISIFDNTYQLFFNTMKTDSCPRILRTEPKMKNIKFINTLRLNNNGKDNGYIWGEPFSNNRLLSGNIPAGKTSLSIKGDIPNPGLFLGETIANALTKEGFRINAVTTSQEKYYADMFSTNRQSEDAEHIFYNHYSKPLKDIIRIVNVKSNNHYAEHLIRTIGRQQNKDIYSDALTEGTKFTESYWAAKGFDTSGLFMYDGCGLAPSNAITPQFMCDVLRYMYTNSKYSESFLSSMPKAGIEGTVRNFLKGTRLEGKVFVKSGSIANVQCFAGYYIDGNKQYVFTIMINNFEKDSRKNTVKVIEQILLNAFP